MGVISTVRGALAPSAIRQAFRAPAPAPLPRIGKKGPPIAIVLPPLSRYTRLVEYGALDADPQDWFSTMQRADYGDTGPMIDLFADARDRDTHLNSVVSKRVQSMMGRPIVVRPPEGFENDREALDAAAFVRHILLRESRAFRSMLTHLMTGAAYGYAVSPIRWETNAEGYAVPHLQWAHCNRFAFHRDTYALGFYEGPYRTHTKVCPLSNYPDCFVAHVPMGGRSDYPWRRGPIRSCIIPSFIKRKGLAFALTLAERFGGPQPFATVPPGMDHDGQSSNDTIAQVQEALQNLSRSWSMVVSEGIKIDSIPGAGNVSGEIHKFIIEWADTTESIGMLGQNLSTKVEGGSFAAAESHRWVAGDIHLADATEVGETITQQVAEPVIRYNKPGAPVPVVEVNTGTRQVPTREMVEAGIFSDDELRRGMGHEAKPNGEGAEYRKPVVVQVPAAIGDAPEEELDVEVEEPTAEPAPGEAIETEPTSPTEATAKDPSTGLNGAQMDALKTALLDASTGALPVDTVKAMLLASLPISEAQVEQMLAPILAKGVTPPAPAPEAPPAEAA